MKNTYRKSKEWVIHGKQNSDNTKICTRKCGRGFSNPTEIQKQDSGICEEKKLSRESFRSKTSTDESFTGSKLD